VSPSARASRLEARRFGARLSRIVVLGTLLLGAIGCGVQNPSPGGGRELTSNLRGDSGDAAILLRNAQYLKIIGQPALALKDLEEAHRLYPDNLTVADALAHSYDELGMGQRAQQVYQEALAREPDTPVMLNNLGFSYYLAGNWGQAEKCFRQILARHPNNQTARNNLGLLLCRLGHREEARQLWQKAGGQALAAQKIRQALTILGMAGNSRYAGPAKVEPKIPAAPAAGGAAAAKLAATLTPQKAPASYHPEPPALKPQATQVSAAPTLPPRTGLMAGDQSSPPSAPRKARAAAPLTPGFAPRIAAAAKAGTPNIRPVAVSQTDTQGRAAGKTLKKKLQIDRPKYLTARELMETNIAILNGNGSHDLAHETRSRLSLEGFNVVDIGNYRDFGVPRTIIYYRPDSEHVASFLSNRFFPGAEVEPAPQLADRIDVKIVLGHDLSLPQHAGTTRTRVGKSL
jgi:Flp pilus assembly protein TadD